MGSWSLPSGTGLFQGVARRAWTAPTSQRSSLGRLWAARVFTTSRPTPMRWVMPPHALPSQTPGSHLASRRALAPACLGLRHITISPSLRLSSRGALPKRRS